MSQAQDTTPTAASTPTSSAAIDPVTMAEAPEVSKPTLEPDTPTEPLPPADADPTEAGEAAEPTLELTVPSGSLLAPAATTSASPIEPTPESTISANAIACRDLAKANPKDIFELRRDNRFGGLEKITKGIADNLRAFNKRQHHVMDPALYSALKLDVIVFELNKILGSLAVLETRSARDILDAETPKLVLPDPEVTIVDTVEEVAPMLEAMMTGLDLDSLTEEPVFSIDTEGSAKSMIQILDHAANHAYLVGLHLLNAEAFTTPATINGTVWTLQSILESPQLPKLFYDCRGDSASLFQSWNITLSGVIDCQLLDQATRGRDDDRYRVHGFGEAIVARMRANLSDGSLYQVNQTKWYGVLAMKKGHEEAAREFRISQGDPNVAQRLIAEHNEENAVREAAGLPRLERDGPDVFTLRPLPDLERRYAVQDVALLPLIYKRNTRHKKYSDEWAMRVKMETEKRLKESRKEGRAEVKGNAPPETWGGFGHVERVVDPKWWL